jgi:hypothetical protein
MFVVAVLTTSLIGCGNPWADDSSLSLVDAGNDRAVLEYARHWSGWEILPSSIWVADLNAGETSRFKAAHKQADLQAGGDYYVAERASDNGQGSLIVAGQFSTGDEWTLRERDVALKGRLLRQIVLDGDRAVYRTDSGLTIYGLPERAVRKTLTLAVTPVELLAVGGHYAVISTNAQSGGNALVNLDDGSITEPPAAPDNYAPQYFDAAVSDSGLVTGASKSNGAEAVLVLDLPAQTWRVLAEFTHLSGAIATGALVVRGADESVVLVSQSEQFSQQSLELVDRATGARTAVTTALTLDPFSALLRDGRVFWIDRAASVIGTFDVTTHVQMAYPMNFPGE